MRLEFLLFCALSFSIAKSGRVKVRIFDHRAEHDPISNYGTGPFKFRNYGWGINYEFEPDGRFQQEKGYGFVKIFARDFCKYKDRSKCRDSQDLSLYNDYKSFNNGEPFWGQPPADVVRDHERFQTSKEPHPTGPRGEQEGSSEEKTRDTRDEEKYHDYHRNNYESTDHDRPYYRNQPQYLKKNFDDRASPEASKGDPESDQTHYDGEPNYYRRFDYSEPSQPRRRLALPRINEEYSPFKRYSLLAKSLNYDDSEERKVYLHQVRRHRKLFNQSPSAHSKSHRRMDGHDTLIGDLRERKYRTDDGVNYVESLKAIEDDLMPNLLENIDHSKYFLRIPKKQIS